MKLMNINKNIFLSIMLFLFIASCELEPEIYDKISPENYTKNEADISAAVTGLYYDLGKAWAPHNFDDSHLMLNILTTDELTTAWGHRWQSNNEFLFTESSSQVRINWEKYVQGITRATLLLESFEKAEIENQELIERYSAEVRTIRAFFAFSLFDLYGPVPFITDSKEVEDLKKLPQLERPSREWMIDFIESELLWCADRLPGRNYNSNEDYGRVTGGTALTILLKLYMQEKDWGKALPVTDAIMNLGYELNPDYVEVFSIDNENYNNKEIIFSIVRMADPATHGTTWFACTMPQVPPMKIDVEMTIWGGLKVPWEHYDKFDSTDTRRTNMIRYYHEANTDTIVDFRYVTHYKAVGANPLKYGFDPGQNGDTQGNDLILYRYADIILSRAEILNELNGPTQEAIDLINQIRSRANVANINLTDFDQDSLRNFILEERGLELWCEGVRRQDLLRHGKFIAAAVADGYEAKEKHKLFPIPQDAREENPLLEQNPGWN
ncbi:MAG: RagB/SusD family nutrient uptake outer membrane protein [Bacteroidales bacterium]|nr:MAG: RagB/SusD family nutrient uptake outer membrane protein [Bacteroidales bacterium]